MSPSSILYTLKQRKCPIRTVKKWAQKYAVDESFFEKIDTEEKAYVLGFLMSDGNVDKTMRSFRWQLAIADNLHLEKIQDILQSTHPITIIKGKQYKKYLTHDSITLRIGSKKMCKDLAMLGCTPAKTLTLQFPQLPSELIRHFIRGYFDGDGTICSSKAYKKGIETTSQYAAGIVGANKKFMYKVREFFIKDGGMTEVKMEIRYTNRAKHPAYNIKWGGRGNLRKFYDYLYTGATVFMDRKKQKFEEILGIPNTNPNV